MKNITTSFVDSFSKKNFSYDKNKNSNLNYNPKSNETFNRLKYLNNNKKYIKNNNNISNSNINNNFIDSFTQNHNSNLSLLNELIEQSNKLFNNSKECEFNNKTNEKNILLNSSENYKKFSPQKILIKKIKLNSSQKNLKPINNNNNSNNKIIKKIKLNIDCNLENNNNINNNKNKNNINNIENNTENLKIIKNITQMNENKYSFTIIPGNNEQLIKNCMKHRKNWEEIPKNKLNNNNAKNINLFWSPLSYSVNFNNYSNNNLNSNNNNNICLNYNNNIVNHFEFHNSISNKINLFTNLMYYCELTSKILFNFFPLTIIFRFGHLIYMEQLKVFSYFFNEMKSLIEIDKKRKYGNFFYLGNFEKIGYKTLLFIPKNFYKGKNYWLVKASNFNRGRFIEICNSISGINNAIQKFYEGDKKKFIDLANDEIEKNLSFNFKNVVLPKLNKNSQNNNNNDNYSNSENNNNLDNNIKTFTSPIKKIPSYPHKYTNLINRKINLSNNKPKKHKKKKENTKNEIHSFIDISGNIENVTTNNNNENNNKIFKSITKVIIQKYLEQPLLYHKRKFDMRIWVFLNFDGSIYMFKEGHLKASSLNFNLNSKDLFIHLTNYSVQKYNINFSKFEFGNEISFEQFQNSLINEHKLNLNVKNDIIPKIKEIIVCSMKSVEKKINKFQRNFCFELFGYDFIFDKDANPFLLEINTNPGLEESSPLINMLVPRMIDDLFRLTIDKIFQTKFDENVFEIKKNGEKKYVSPFKVTGYDDDENLWENIGKIEF